MKLKEILSEMSMPIVKSPEQAVDIIKQAYNAAITKKSPNADLYGPLHSAAKYLGQLNNPEKYSRFIKMATAAKKAMDKSRGTLAKQQTQFTTAKGA
jgi:hypothetical protein